jgi:hypothetical protein
MPLGAAAERALGQAVAAGGAAVAGPLHGYLSTAYVS